ncbi:hypothetical protein ACFVU2_14020 [Leifsonia sp. NPDC058194]|uniref:hypothetical protein n=1 Tax=Leifsonia sp. NPDC058194 TaxID=3346374 RepID=UPI0036D814B2
MTTADPNQDVPAAWPQQPVPPQQQPPQQQAPHYAPQQPWQQPNAPRPAAGGSILRRWPVWAQNTAIVVGAVAVLAIVFFAGFFTGHATDGGQRGGFGTNQNFDPRQFGGGTGGSGGSTQQGGGTGGMTQQGGGS